MSSSPHFKRLALIGFGLIGGSIARAAKAQGLVGEIVTTARSEKSRARVKELGIVDAVVATNVEAAKGADLVILCIPVGACGEVAKEIGKLGLKVTPSVANFVLIHFPTAKGKTSDEADAFLTKRGLVLRGLKNYQLPHALRMTIGTEEANRLVVDGLRDFMAGK